MKNVLRFLGIFALIATIGFSFIACDTGGETHTCSYSSTWSNNATTHYKQCSCGNKIDVENHVGNPCGIYGYNTGSGSSYSLNGVWEVNGTQITVSGNTGVFSAFGSLNALWTDAVNKNYVKIGDQRWRNIQNTGNLTWSAETLGIDFNQSSPNVATGVSYKTVTTIVMSINGQTLTTDGSLTYTRRR